MTGGADLTGVTLSDLARLYLTQLDRSTLYVVCTEVLADKRPVSIRTDGAMSRTAFVGVMSAHGIDVTTKEGILYVCPTRVAVAAVSSSADPAASSQVAPPAISDTGSLAAVSPVVQAAPPPPTRRERLKATGASGYLPKIVNRNGSTAAILWPSEVTWSCPRYLDPTDRTVDERCHAKPSRL